MGCKKPSEKEYKKTTTKNICDSILKEHTYWHIYENSNRLIIFRKPLLFSISPKNLTDYPTYTAVLPCKIYIQILCRKENQKGILKIISLYYVKIEKT